MKKKLAIIGKGTAGAFSATHFMRWTDWDIDWYFDHNIKPQAVGEGSNLVFPLALYENIGFTYQDLKKLDGTVKESIYKQNWGTNVKEFHHHFSPPNIGIHFNAVKFQEYIFSLVQNNKRFKFIEKNVLSDQIDADFIMDCSGKPEINKDNFIESNYIPVNSVHVNQCMWEYPRFQYTLTIARPYGWVFGIPLQNRCSIGYLYNNNINTLEEVKEDVKNIFEEFNLVPSGITNTFSFGNYYRKENYSKRISYNGNASFFLEPLEATSISTMDLIQRSAFSLWTGEASLDRVNNLYFDTINEVEAMIMLHYYAGSSFDTRFWSMAKNNGKLKIDQAIKNSKLVDMILQSDTIKFGYLKEKFEYGTWNPISFNQNLTQLGIRNTLQKYIN